MSSGAGPGGSNAFVHAPVMVDEVTSIFGAVPGGTVADVTVGGGGHARALLRAHRHLDVLGLDRDPTAVAAANLVAEEHPGRMTVRRARFDELPSVMDELGIPALSGVLFDLGVSSPQLDRPERGFSYRVPGPLDMRMDPESGRTASDLVNHGTADELARILRAHADERYAARIARAIVAARPIGDTGHLAEVVRDAIPAGARRRGRHPAMRTFQALRIEVNQELDLLPASLDAAIDALAPGGRIVVLSYHSGEDRIVKDRLRWAETGGCSCPPSLPCGCGAVPKLRLLARGGRTPRPEEIEANPRAASARLRAAERLTPPAAA